MFCSVDDFWQAFAPRWRQEVLAAGEQRRQRAGTVHPSEIMTIVIAFQQAHYRTFTAYYLEHVQPHWRGAFPPLVSYPRFVALLPAVLVPLTAYLQAQLGRWTGFSFIDSTALAVCQTARISQQRVFAGRPARGKTSVGWFFGFKLHLVVNDRGELLAFCLTPGNVDDRRPVPKLARRLFGKLGGDRGSSSQPLAQRLLVEPGLQLITKLRKNMHNRLIACTDALLLRKRAIIETINDQLKHICQIAPTRHRSPVNFLVNVVAGLIAYCHQPKKPALGWDLFVLPPA